MPFYEYKPKSGACDICNGCFVDLQKMSDAPHTSCPDCGKACERVFAVPMVSVRGSEYRAAANAEKRTENLARAKKANGEMREATLKKYDQLPGHTHNCALSGCYGAQVQAEATGGAGGNRYGRLPHLVGTGDRPVGTKKKD